MMVWNFIKYTKNKNNDLTLDRGSLGSWIDEDRSKMRVIMWTAGHMNTDTLNAYCTSFSLITKQNKDEWGTCSWVAIFNKN